MDRLAVEKDLKEYAVREVVLNRLKKAGLPQPKAIDGGDNIFKEWDALKSTHGGVGNIPFNVLGDFLDKWTGLVAYARWVEAIADIDQTTSREIRDTIKKQLYCINEGGREIRDAMVYQEPLYVAYEKKFVNDNAMYVATKALREGYEYRANAISREITRRGADSNDTRRGNNRGSNA